jgi:uncharacterized protein YebE (UPF0316 family)
LSLIGITVVLVAACLAMFARTLIAMRRAATESRRRWIARAAVLIWVTIAVLAPAVMLAALDVLPHWVPGAALVVAFVVGLVASRIARRSTMRTQSFA